MKEQNNVPSGTFEIPTGSYDLEVTDTIGDLGRLGYKVLVTLTLRSNDPGYCIDASSDEKPTGIASMYVGEMDSDKRFPK